MAAPPTHEVYAIEDSDDDVEEEGGYVDYVEVGGDVHLQEGGVYLQAGDGYAAEGGSHLHAGGVYFQESDGYASLEQGGGLVYSHRPHSFRCGIATCRLVFVYFIRTSL